MKGRLPFVAVREVNTVAGGDSWPFLRINEFMDSLGDIIIFVTLHANHSYLQLKIENANCINAAFTSHHGHFKF